jgi:16S rRNA (cytidine1402-2'-O)-methyltransferase
MPGTLFVVATPIGNLDDISPRALRALREASIIAAEDTRRTAHLLARYAIATPTTSLHAHNESQKAPALVERLRAGDHVALVSDAGTPTVSDPGRRLIQAAAAAGLRIESIPGPSAVMAALAASGLAADRFTFLGFPPAKGSARRQWFDDAARAGGTLVFFEAPHRIRRTLAEFLERIGDCPIVLCRELTKAHEELVRGPISAVLSSRFPEKGEFTVVAQAQELGEKTNRAQPSPLSAPAIAAEFGQLTSDGRTSRRQAISHLAKRYGRSSSEIYQLLEDAKNSAE